MCDVRCVMCDVCYANRNFVTNVRLRKNWKIEVGKIRRLRCCDSADDGSGDYGGDYCG